MKYIYKLSFTKPLYIFSYMDTCIAIIMYCQMQLLLFTGKHCLYNFFGYLPATIISLHAKFHVRWCYSFGSTVLQQDLVEEDEEHEKKCFSVFPTFYVQIFGKFSIFMYILDIYVIRNDNNLKLKVKSEFSLSTCLMLINHCNPYNIITSKSGN